MSYIEKGVIEALNLMSKTMSNKLSNKSIKESEKFINDIKNNNISNLKYKEDNINHPSHYTFFQKEVIDIIQDCLTSEEFKGYLKGNLIKYRMRAGLKNDRNEDLAKSNYYQDKLKIL